MRLHTGLSVAYRKEFVAHNSDGTAGLEIEVVMTGELDEEQIDQLLRSEVVGRIACHDSGLIYVVPVTYVYAGAPPLVQRRLPLFTAAASSATLG
jgi:hypothetical protein